MCTDTRSSREHGAGGRFVVWHGSTIARSDVEDSVMRRERGGGQDIPRLLVTFVDRHRKIESAFIRRVLAGGKEQFVMMLVDLKVPTPQGRSAGSWDALACSRLRPGTIIPSICGYSSIVTG